MERLLHEERKHKEKEESSEGNGDAALKVLWPVTTVGSKDISRETVQDSVPSGTKGRGNTKLIRQDNDSSDCDALIVGHEALQVGVVGSWTQVWLIICPMKGQCLWSIKASGTVLRK